jgi:hypothetical protein
LWLLNVFGLFHSLSRIRVGMGDGHGNQAQHGVLLARET